MTLRGQLADLSSAISAMLTIDEGEGLLTSMSMLTSLLAPAVF